MSTTATASFANPGKTPASANNEPLRQGRLITGVITGITVVLLAACLAFAAAEPINARFSKCSGRTIQVELNVTTAVPGSVILTLTLPRGTRLTAAEPPHNKYNKGKNQAKWLLMGLSPGRHHINIQVSNNIDESGIKAQIRYINSATGRLSVIDVIK